MATLEKLVKALDALKVLNSSSNEFSDESIARKKEKIGLCTTIADSMCSSQIKCASNFASLLSISMETLLKMCDDPDSNIRMIADESLNRIIRSMMDNNIVKVHLELHKEIKKNGSVRSMRAALWRFAEIAHMIRPQKGKPYVQNLFPCLIEISKRKEELLLETLSVAIPKIMKALGTFTTDSDIKKLLKSFMNNLSDNVPVVRRTAASSILAICQHCRKPDYFIAFALYANIESLVPVQEDRNKSLVLGSLNCIRMLLPHLPKFSKDSDPGLSGSFGVRFSAEYASLNVDKLIQVYELCLHCTYDSNHNVVTAALETLHQLLTSAPTSLIEVLMSDDGLTRSRIMPTDSDPISHRSISEASLSLSVALPDEATLSDGPEETIKSTRLVQWINDFPTFETQAVSSLPQKSFSEDTDSSSEFSPVLRHMEPLPIAEPIHRAPSLESDLLIGRGNETPSPVSSVSVTNLNNYVLMNIGSVVMSGQKPIIYCCRRLVSGFLFPESNTNIRIRVSVRTLALQCVSQIVRIFPDIFVYPIENNSDRTISSFSHICDVLDFDTYPDQQIRGMTRLLIGHFINSVLTQCDRGFSEWYDGVKLRTTYKIKILSLPKLIDHLVLGLQDETSVCIRHTVGSIATCIRSLMNSKDSHTVLPILRSLTDVSKNSYWLVKVKLLELLADLPYINIHYLTGNSEFQGNILNYVLVPLLGDEDNRVRKSSSECIVKAVPLLYYQIDEKKEDLVVTASLRNSSSLFDGLFSKSSIKNIRHCYIEKTLSRIVHMLSQMLLQASSKSVMAGCCEALCLLSQTFLTKDYPHAWQCTLNTTKIGHSASSGLLSSLLTLLSSTPTALDLNIQNWLFILVGNIFYGLAVCSLNNPHNKGSSESKIPWASFHDKKFASISKTLLSHILQVLCLYVRVLEETPLHSSSASPIKHLVRGRQASPARPHIDTEDEGVTEEETTKASSQNIIIANHFPFYSKLYEILRSAYVHYKTVLGNSDQLSRLLRSILGTLSQVLEFSTPVETGDIVEEILGYLRVTINLESTPSVNAVQQLLKSLFTANLIAQWDEDRANPPLEIRPKLSPNDDKDYSGFYGNVIEKSLNNVTEYIEEKSLHLNERSKSFSSPAHERKASSILKGLGRNTDRNTLASFIRLFEPMVIQALKQYTVTSDVILQSAVLSLLTQLVQLRVNYCLLDSDQIFIKFVQKQFEFLELGQISDVELLVAKIFHFLVHLSYEKNHSKPVINIARVIQLCDGLMASGQDPLTHCVPALLPIVEHVFLATIYIDGKQVDAQREMVIAMLLRIAEHHQVLEVINLILQEGWRWEDKWRRWSRQSADVILPLLGEGRVRLTTPTALFTFLNFLNNLAPGTLRPIDPILKALFNVHQALIDGANFIHSFSAMLMMIIYIICYGKEDGVLSRLEDLNLCVSEKGNDPLNAMASNQNNSPQTVMSRLFFKIISSITQELYMVLFNTTNSYEYTDYLEYLLVHFLLCFIYMFQSGKYYQICNKMTSIINEIDSETFQELNQMFYSFSLKLPIVTFLWCCLLQLMKQQDNDFWKKVMLPVSSVKSYKFKNYDSENRNESCLNQDIVMQGSIIFYCKFFDKNSSAIESFSNFLSSNLQQIVLLSRERHVLNWFENINKNPNFSRVILQVISETSIYQKTPGFVCQLLNCLKFVHPKQFGSLLKLIVLKLFDNQHLAPARVASSLACRCAEYLLTLEREEVVKQIKKEDLLMIIQQLTKSTQTARRHSGLISLLDKLSSQNLDLPPLDVDQGRSVNTASIPTIVLDRTWFLTQVKSRCCQPESSTRQCAYLLSELEYDDILCVLRCQQFNYGILQYCFLLGTQLSLQGRNKENQTDTDYLSPLYMAARLSLTQHIHHLQSLLPKTLQVFCPMGRLSSSRETIYQERVNELFSDKEFSNVVFRLIPVMTSYFSSLSELKDYNISSLVPRDSWESLTRFLVLCIEAVHWLLNLQLKPSNWPNLLYNALKCASTMLKQNEISDSLTLTDLGSVVSTLIKVINECSSSGLPNEISMYKTVLSNTKDATQSGFSHLCYQMADLIKWLEKYNSKLYDFPDFLAINVKHIVMGIGRCPLVNWYCRMPMEAWSYTTIDETMSPPSIPPHLFQDIDYLHQIIFRLSLFGWTNRQQFEETWVSLLTMINTNHSFEGGPEELNAVMQVNSIALQAITSLLVQTTLVPKSGNPNTSNYLHVPRDRRLDLSSNSWGRKLEDVSNTVCLKIKDSVKNIKTNIVVNEVNEPCNLEKIICPGRYSYSQVSVQYLRTAITPPDGRLSTADTCHEFIRHQKRLTESGIDLHSCIRLLLDLFLQWTQLETGISLNLQLEIVKSIVILSDLFTERSHFTWMLKICLRLSSSCQEDEILHQYLVVAVCKATAVLAVIESDVLEKVLKLLEQCLKSTFAPTRTSGLHSLIYLIQSWSIGNKNLTVILDSTSGKSNLSDPRARICQLGADYINKHFDTDSLSLSNKEQCVTLAVIFNLLEHSPQDLAQDINAFIVKLIKAASSTPHSCIYRMFVQGINRIILLNKLSVIREPSTWLALERLSHPDPVFSLPALQLLLSCIYSGEFGNVISEHSEIDPEKLVVTMEKTSALFDRIKKGSPLEVECVCAALPCLLADFFPASEVLTKVIGEFLSPNQPHPQLLSVVVFQVLSQACREDQLPLLQAWLVMSLSNFTHALPITVSTWCLTCFFISSSLNPWMRAIFPYIQSRIGRCSNEDRKLLCIAASDFYKQLPDESQKDKFLKTFKDAASSPRSPFADVIASL
uniref:Huntingtin n=1 Tax=Clastoptera arizonana TaxID=38151 RepID=A0A1B6D7Q0_9HEMI